MRFYTAVAFLTTIPLPRWLAGTKTIPDGAGADTFARSVPYFPLVGLMLGLIMVGLDFLLHLVFPPLVVAAFLVIALFILTGGLHFEGFVDSCDGLLTAKSPEERLAIMKDSRSGAFGVAGAGALLLLRFAALASLTGDARWLALLLAPVLSRWAMAYTLAAFPYGRSGSGLGKIFKDYLRTKHTIYATVVALVLALAIWQLNGLATWGVACLVAWLLARYTLSRIPGLTGDVYGAINEVTEVAILLFVPIMVTLSNWSM